MRKWLVLALVAVMCFMMCAVAETPECEHLNVDYSETYTVINYIDDDNDVHLKVVYGVRDYTCKDCGMHGADKPVERYAEREKHVMQNGKCSVCGHVEILPTLPSESESPQCSHWYADFSKWYSIISYEYEDGNDDTHLKLIYHARDYDCGDCGTSGTMVSSEQYGEEEKHTIENGKCSLCGYIVSPLITEDPTTTITPIPDVTVTPTPAIKPTSTPTEEPDAEPTMPTVTDEPLTTETPVPAATSTPVPTATAKPSKKTSKRNTAVVEELRILNVETVLAEDELNQLNTLEIKEQILTFLSAIGFEDQVNCVLENADKALSDAATALKEQVQQRLSEMDEEQRAEFEATLLENFEQVVVETDTGAYTLPVLEVEVKKGDTIDIVHYSFCYENGKWGFKRVEIPEETIASVQEALNGLGYDCGTIDGICGKKTQTALRNFQKDNALYEVDAITFEVIRTLRDMGAEI